MHVLSTSFVVANGFGTSPSTAELRHFLADKALLISMMKMSFQIFKIQKYNLTHCFPNPIS